MFQHFNLLNFLPIEYSFTVEELEDRLSINIREEISYIEDEDLNLTPPEEFINAEEIIWDPPQEEPLELTVTPPPTDESDFLEIILEIITVNDVVEVITID